MTVSDMSWMRNVLVGLEDLSSYFLVVDICESLIGIAFFEELVLARVFERKYHAYLQLTPFAFSLQFKVLPLSLLPCFPNIMDSNPLEP